MRRLPTGSRSRTAGGVEEAVAALFARQHGAATRAQLLESGLEAEQVRARLGSGRLRVVHRGVYMLGDLRGSLEPRRAREMAAVLACGPRAVLSHGSGAWLRGWHPRPAVPDVTVPWEARRIREGVRIHRSSGLAQAETEIVDGIPVTSALRTLLDLATVVGARDLERAAARAERAGAVDADALRAGAARLAGRPGAANARAVFLAQEERAFTRSEAEDLCLELIRAGGLPAPLTNVVVAGHEVDFYWPAVRLVVEVDGYANHGNRRSFEHDHRRDGDLAANGLRVLRVTWLQLTTEPKRTLVRIALALGRPG